MPLDSDSKFPPLPEQIFPDRLRQIDPEGCREKEEELRDWYLKLLNVLQGN
jgi:hypothetical protein